MKLTYVARLGDEGRRVYYILKRDLRLSASQVKRLKVADAITLNGACVFTDVRVRPGDIVAAELALIEPPPDFPPERGAVEALYENAAFLAVNKPAGMLTHPSRAKFTGTLANFVSGYLLDREGSPAVHAVNRLDRDTSGVVLFAKSAHFKTLAVEALENDPSEKVYTAYLFGELPGERGTIDLPIERPEPGLMRRAVGEGGKRAVTHYETLRKTVVDGSVLTQARLTLETGRTHQIRVHCAHLGAPLIGDFLYGSGASAAFSQEQGFARQLLHAEGLRFQDPFTGEEARITAPVNREDLRKCADFFKFPIDNPHMMG